MEEGVVVVVHLVADQLLSRTTTREWTAPLSGPRSSRRRAIQSSEHFILLGAVSGDEDRTLRGKARCRRFFLVMTDWNKLIDGRCQ